MEAIFLKILNMSLSAGVVIAAVLLVRALLRAAPKKWSYLLWAAAGFRLCCPVSLRSAFSLFALRPVRPAVTPAVSGAPVAALEYLPRAAGAAAPLASPPPALPAGGALEQTGEALVSAAPPVNWTAVGAAVWCLGMAAMLLCAAVSYLRLRRALADAVRLQGDVWESDRIRSPFILGLARPRIYLPAGLDGSALGYVMAHERYHLRRGDHLVKAFAFALLTAHWFNPLVWLAFSLMGKDQEMSCDEAVLSGAGNIRRDYSAALLSFATNGRFPAPGPLAFGETGVKSRIKNALRWKKPKLWATLTAAALCLAVTAACALNPGEKAAEPPEPDPAPAEETAGSDAAERLLTLFSNSISGGFPDRVAFTVPAEGGGTWDVRVVGSAVTPTGRVVPLSYFDKVDTWTPGMGYTFDFADVEGLRELTMHLRLTDGDGVTSERSIDLMERLGIPVYEPPAPDAATIRAVADRLFGTYDHPGVPVTITITDRSTGRVDTFQWQDTQRPSVDGTLGYWLGNEGVWERYTLTEDLDSRNRGPYILRIENADGDYLAAYSGAPYLTVNGTTFVCTSSIHDGWMMPYGLLCDQTARAAYFADAQQNDITAPGSVTDYGEAARLIAEAYLARLLDRPAWLAGRAQDGYVESAEVFDAYYGPDMPNFCFNMRLKLKIDEPDTVHWQAGAGLGAPDARGYYEWGLEVVVMKLDDGDWHFYDAGTGGYSVYLPGYGNNFSFMETCGASELLDLYFKTAGATRDWRVLLALRENRTVDEVKTAMAALTDAQRAELLAGMERFNERFGENRSEDGSYWPPLFDLEQYR